MVHGALSQEKRRKKTTFIVHELYLNKTFLQFHTSIELLSSYSSPPV